MTTAVRDKTELKVERQLSSEEYDAMIRELRQTHAHAFKNLSVDRFIAEKRREALAE